MKSIKLLSSIWMYVILIFISCSKENTADYTGDRAKVNPQISISAFESLNKVGVSGSLHSLKSDNQTVISWDKNHDLIIQLKPQVASTAENLHAFAAINTTINPGIYYRLLVFDGENKFLFSKDYIAGKEREEGINLSTTENYNIIAYSFSKDKMLPELSLAKGDNISKAILDLNQYEDVMLASALNMRFKAGENNLGLVLKHQFSEVNIILNSSAVGKIDNIGEAYIMNTYNEAHLNMGSQSSFPKNISYKGLGDKRVVNFFEMSSTNPYQAESRHTIFYADGNSSNSIILSTLSIDGITKSNIVLYNLVAQPGVSYSIELALKPKFPENSAINVGQQVLWAPGNLIKIAEGKYAFASSQGDYGDYWYRDPDGHVYSNPYDFSSKSKMDVGYLVKDICSEVGSEWRMPTQQDVLELEKLSKWYETPSNKYYGIYIKNGEKVSGVYFGTSVQPSEADQDKYLFLPAAGAYNSGNEQEIGISCFYWHSGLGKDGEGTSFQLAPTYISSRNNGGLDSNRANTLRCVRSK